MVFRGGFGRLRFRSIRNFGRNRIPRSSSGKAGELIAITSASASRALHTKMQLRSREGVGVMAVAAAVVMFNLLYTLHGHSRLQRLHQVEEENQNSASEQLRSEPQYLG